MKQWTVKVEDQEYDVDAPDESTAWAWANQFHKERPKTSFIEDVKMGLAGATNALDTGITLAGRGLETLVRKERSIEDEDALFRNMEERRKNRNQWANPNNAVQSFGGQVAGTVATLPAQILAMPGGAAERMTQMIDMGESVETTRKAGLMDTALTMGAVALPGSVGKTLLGKAATGAGLNVAAGGLTDAYTQEVAEQEATKKAFDPLDPRRRTMEAIIGAGLGPMASKRPEHQKPASNKIEEIVIQKKQAQTQPPEDVQFWKDRAEQMTQDARNQPIHVDSQGNAGIDPGAMRAMAEIEGQQVRGKQFGGENALGVEEGNLRPQSAFEPETVQAPLDTLGQGRQIDPSTGKVMTGMAEDVPTIDFQLRQDVLQSPEISKAIDDFRQVDAELQKKLDNLSVKIEKEAKFLQDLENKNDTDYTALDKLLEQQAKLEEQRNANQQEFAAGMEQLGIRTPQDAIGLQKLYESGGPLRYPEQPKHTVDARAEAAARMQFRATSKETLGKVGRMKKQGGHIDPQVFAEGFKKLTRALSNLTNQPWVKAKFPADRFMTNEDGTPLIMLHGTTHEFDAFNWGTQGTHAGFTVPSHLIFQGGFDAATRPKQTGRTSASSIRVGSKNQIPFAKNNGDVGYISEKANIRPVTLKKGNYPFIDFDYGNWSPVVLLKSNLPVKIDGVTYNTPSEAIRAIAEQNGKPISTQRWVSLRKIFDQEMGNDAAQTKIFAMMLKEAGIDGFFYRNMSENLRKREEYRRPKEMHGMMLSNPVAKETTSFVTYDPRNLVSLFDDPKPSVSIPKKQMGAADIDLLANIATLGGWGAAKKLAQALNASKQSPLAGPEHQANAMSRVPGLKDIADDYVKTDLTPEKVLEQALKEEDSGKGSAAVGGTLMLSKIKGSSLVYGVYNWFNTANKRAAMYDRNLVKPFESKVQSLFSTGEAADLHKLILAEAENQVRMTPEELRGKVSERIIEAHEDYYRMMDGTLELENKARSLRGEPPIDALDAYFASRWSGPWRAPVYDSNGKLVWWIAESSEKRAKDALAYLAQNYDINPLDPRTKVNYLKEGRDKANVEAGYREMLKLLGEDDPAVQQIREALKEYYKQEGAETLGQDKHFEKKGGVRGFVGDRPWTDSVKDTKEFWREQIQYARNGIRWGEMQSAVDNTKKVLADERIAHQENNIAFAREAAKNYLGFGTHKLVRDAENFLGKYWSKYIPAEFSKGVDVAKSIFYVKTLGVANVPFTVASVVQPIFTGPWHTKLSLEGFNHNPVTTMFSSVKNANAILLNHMGVKVPMDDFAQQAYRYVEQNGIIDINQFSDVQYLGNPKVEAGMKVAGANMVAAEAMARSYAFMSFAHHLKQSGKYGNDLGRLFQRAEDLTNLSMVDYRHFERANMFNRTGVAGNALSTLQTFKINQLNQLYLLGKNAVKGLENGSARDVLPLMHLLGVQMMMGGMVGMFAVETLDSLWELLKKGLSQVSPKAYTKIKDASIKQGMIEGLPEWASYGGVSSLTGVNWASRFDAGTIVDPSLEDLFPFVTDLSTTAGAAFKAVTSPGEGNLKEAAYQMSPASTKGLVETSMFAHGKQGDKTVFGKVTDYHTGNIARDERQQSLRKWGLRDLQEAKEQELMFRNNKTSAQINETRRRVAESFRRDVLEGDFEGARSKAVTYAELEGDVNALMGTLSEAAIKQNTTQLQRIYMEASGISGAQKAKRYKESIESVR